MKANNLPFIYSLLILLAAFNPAFGQTGPGRGNITGNYYGKIIDSDTKRGIEYVSVQIWTENDTSSQNNKALFLGGQLTDSKGEFRLENIPARGEHILKISFMGYASLEKKISFNLQSKDNRQDPGGILKDLGNIRLKVSQHELNEVSVTESATQITLALDKKIFKVDKNAVTAGGTAEDALKAMPSVSVDIDGNVSVRNASPEIYVDGRPTTLTVDQIPADDIDQVELITNPSSKFDASSGGSAGIINIVMKKNKRNGMNGNIRAGMDSNLGANIGGDINYRENKVNAFISANLNHRINKSKGESIRTTLQDTPSVIISQRTESINEGNMAVGRGGLDWFINNRNTLTLAVNGHSMNFEPTDEVFGTNDSLYSTGIVRSSSIRNTTLSRRPQPFGLQILYKYLFPKEGEEWTADISLNRTYFMGKGEYNTFYPETNFTNTEKQEIESRTRFIIAQTDFVNPLSGGRKFELGGRASLRYYQSENQIFHLSDSGNQYTPVYQFADKYKFDDQVYAAYGNFLQSFTKWGYQLGLRIESSKYLGVLTDIDSSFSNSFPLSIFPSLYLSYKLNEQDQLLLNYSRKINRPSFFQLLPFTDFADSLLLARGNPGLLPEFVNSIELSYQNIFNNGSNLLFTLYGRYVPGLITRYQFEEFNSTLNKNVIVATYANANSSLAYGLESNYRINLFKLLELNSNLNFYNAEIDASNIDGYLKQSQFTWLVKENATIRFPKQWSIQLTGEYQSKAAFLSDGGGGGGGPFSFGSSGRSGGHSGPSSMGRGDLNSTAQGYNLAFGSMDIAIRKELWNRTANITLSMQDVFNTRKRGSHSESLFFLQDSWRVRDPQLVKINFSWRFGKADASLFKRKNDRQNTEGMESM